MKLAKVIAWIGVFAMTGALLNGFVNGSFFEDGSVILNNPWGIVSLVDLYVGFILFAMWIAFPALPPFPQNRTLLPNFTCFAINIPISSIFLA